MEYPNLSFDLNRIGVAMSLGASDNFYSHAFFRKLVDYYLGGFKDYNNMFVSPLHTSDKVNCQKLGFFSEIK